MASSSRTRSRAGHLKSMDPSKPLLSGDSCTNHFEPSAPMTDVSSGADDWPERLRHHRSTAASVTMTTSPSAGTNSPFSTATMSTTSAVTPRTSRNSSANTSSMTGLVVTMFRCMESPPPRCTFIGFGVIGDFTNPFSRITSFACRIQMSSIAVTRTLVREYFMTTTVRTWT